jgi:hypothetical protein
MAFQLVQCHSLFSAHSFGFQLAIQNLPCHSKLEVPTCCIESVILTVFYSHLRVINNTFTIKPTCNPFH